MIVAMSPSGKVIDIDLRENYETPSYLAKLKDFLQSFKNKTIGEISHIDTVAGATVSSEAIKKSVLLAAEKAGRLILNQEGKSISGGKISLKVIAGIVIFSLFFLLYYLKRTRATRLLLDVISLAILGFYLNLPLSLDHIFKFLELNFPDIISGIGIIVIAIVAFLPAIGGNNIYCREICPFGAYQRLLAAISPVKLKPSPSLKRKSTRIRDIILLLLIILHFGLNLKGLTTVEPYSSFFTLEVSGGFLIYVIVITIISLFYPMFWCSYLCPTGAFLDGIKIHSPRRKRSP